MLTPATCLADVRPWLMNKKVTWEPYGNKGVLLRAHPHYGYEIYRSEPRQRTTWLIRRVATSAALCQAIAHPPKAFPAELRQLFTKTNTVEAGVLTTQTQAKAALCGILTSPGTEWDLPSWIFQYQSLLKSKIK